MASEFAKHVVPFVRGCGFEPILSSSFVTTPSCSFYAKEMGCLGALVMTASHNPYNWLGLKIKSFNGCSVDKSFTSEVEKRLMLGNSIEKIDGVMHACGHDLHISIGLGVAKIVKDLKLNFGTRIIFQPAEEIASGARWMIKDGATNGLTHILGVHVYPDLSVGTIGIKEGSLTAAAGELKVEIKGKSGLGARPHEGVDAIWVASKVISGIQEAITRKLDPLDPVVITFGKINGGNAFNVLAEKVNLIGTVRCTNLKVFKNIGNWLNENITSLANSCGAEAKVIFREITPAVNNNSEINRVLRDSGIKVLGQENVIELQKPSLGAEDFAEFLKDIPGAMFRLGVSSSNGCAPLHSSKFDPDERAIAVGIKVITESIVKLNNKKINKID